MTQTKRRVDTNFTNLREFNTPNPFVQIREIRVNPFPSVFIRVHPWFLPLEP